MDISFPSNRDSLDLIEKKGFGILPHLHDCCFAPGASDKSFARGLYEKFRKEPHPNFHANPLHMGRYQFVIDHYAGPVVYDAEGFVEKNMDEVPQEAFDLLSSSSNRFVAQLQLQMRLPTLSERSRSMISSSTNRKHKPTVGSNFTMQLRELRERIDATSQNYVRCLKPNQDLLPDAYDPVVIIDQLRCLGVLEAVEITRSGFPQRFTHDTFVERYYIRAVREFIKAKRARKSAADLCRTILEASKTEQIR